jgi:hypothetical protein
VLLALAPLAFATAIFATMGNFFAGHLMLLAGTAALIGGALHRYAPQYPIGSVGAVPTLPSGRESAAVGR